MISWIALGLMPLLGPLLKLRTTPPHLPEGTNTIRQLKPSQSYLSYRYLGSLLVSAQGFLVSGVVTAGLVRDLGRWGGLLGGLLILVSLISTAVMLVATRLDWELRHYVIGDRSLRVRGGALVQSEVTLSFANVQNVEVTQGPIQRLFGFKNLHVTTAGGGQPTEKGGLDSLHGAVLAGLQNAEEIRDLMLRTLRQQKDSGLGDADEQHALPTGGAPDPLLAVLEAARELRVAAERATSAVTPAG